MKNKIKFLPEYCTTCLWLYENGCYTPVKDYHKLALSKVLIEKLIKFDEEIMNIIDWNDPGGESPMSIEKRYALYEYGKTLYREVEINLGDAYKIINASDWINPYKG